MTRYDDWLNKPVQTISGMDPWAARALAATLGRDGAAAPADDGDLPCLWHWIYFLETLDRADIAHDGHQKRGAFLPPIPHPRRMFVGGRTQVHRPLKLGREAVQTRAVTAIEEKRPGPEGMWLVTVRSDYRQDGVDCVREELDYAYLGAPAAPMTAGEPVAPPAAPWRAEVTPDVVMLMRFSALTFNGHRIHYDRDYCTEEGYPGIVVHGPLTAVLLSELARREGERPVTGFSFRARSPLFVDGSVRLGGTPQADDTVAFEAHDASGRLSMSATVWTRGGPFGSG